MKTIVRSWIQHYPEENINKVMHMQMSITNNSRVQKHNKIDKDQTSEIHLSPRELDKLRTKPGLAKLPQNSITSNNNILDIESNNASYKNIKMGTISGRSQYQSIFRAAHFLGLFPVSGLSTSSKRRKDGEIAERSDAEGIVFRPASWRLLATFVFIVAVLFLEGMGLIHMLVATDRSFKDSHVNFVTYRHGTIASDLAPVLHYGATVIFSEYY